MINMVFVLHFKRAIPDDPTAAASKMCHSLHTHAYTLPSSMQMNTQFIDYAAFRLCKL